MKQVVQPLGGGPVQVVDVAAPVIDAHQVLVETMHSIVSPGTETAVASTAQSSPLGKVRAHPQLLGDAVQKVRDPTDLTADPGRRSSPSPRSPFATRMGASGPPPLIGPQ